MIDTWTLYWILMLDNIQCFFGIGGFLILVGALMTFMVYAVSEGDFPLFVCKYMGILGGILVCIATLLPNTNQMAILYVMPKIANSEFVKNLPPKLEKLIENGIENLIEKKN